MSQTVSSSSQRPDRQRILDLARDLVDDLEAVTLNEIDGEFYWRICRDDLLGPLSQLAESIAPHIVDPARRHEQFDEAQQQAIDEERRRLVGLPDDNLRELALDWFTQELKAKELFAQGQQFAEQLPGFVWEHYSQRRRIPMRAPMTITATERGRALAIRIWSRGATGDDLEAFVRTFPPEFYIIPEPPSFSTEVEGRSTQDIEPQPISRVSLQIDFELVTEPPVSASTDPPEDSVDPPFIQITVWMPLPPRGLIGNAYEAIVRQQHQWHLELRGGVSNQEKIVAIRTWSVGLLTKDGKRFVDAEFEVAKLMGLKSWTNTRFTQARQTLVTRVPEAKSYLFANTRA